ncbi:MAG: hypothetical protein ACU0DT_11155, partial [Albimonas sp.]|uniref:hypothetical protein n=1 Tax=Albimonas sp. TaxID=1872425 RepID=UPI004055C813
GALVYEVEVLEGEVAESGSDVALFIDPVAYFGPRVRFYAGPRAGVAVVGPRRRPVWRPRCFYSPYYRHDICRTY